MAGDDHAKAIASLETKMDLVLESVKEIKMYYVQKAQFEDLKERVDKLENAPTKYVNTLISLAGIAVALFAVFHK